MKRKKDLLEKIGSKIIFNDEKIKISKEGNQWVFEINNELTTDIAEATALMMRICGKDSFVWEIEIKDINTDVIEPKKSLYWLTGGNNEWKTLPNYKNPWCESYLDFQEQYGVTIINIIKKSKKIGDIRNQFIKKLNLPTLYEFSLSKNLIK